ncbi:hypothetical protein MSAN_00240000 [Mycena sanguinolenta]|uniref:Uncharacterized protein n=1 Tax=Mycena sanguinolenta TaxID=230812 RepID=A0A8H6ZMF6_9AGAR|nr:hypothetical protein MSAN_00240000 [Mycena sanguinolenta]
MLNALLFNSSARMYNLRILLLITIALIPTTLVSLPKANSDTWLAFYDRYVMGISIASSCLILPHHIFRLYLSKLMAILDVCLTLVEICMMAYLAGFSIENHMWGSGSTFLSFTLVARPIQLASLLASAIWSTATIMSSPQKITHQYFEFLGGCSQPHGPYTPLRILTNRSVSKPLVRGEFRAIVIIRGIVLSIFMYRAGNTWTIYHPLYPTERTGVHKAGPHKRCSSLGRKREYWAKSWHHSAYLIVRPIRGRRRERRRWSLFFGRKSQWNELSRVNLH